LVEGEKNLTNMEVKWLIDSNVCVETLLTPFCLWERAIWNCSKESDSLILLKPKDIATSWRHNNSWSSSDSRGAGYSIGKEEELSTESIVYATRSLENHRQGTERQEVECQRWAVGRTNVYAVWLAGWLIEEERKRKETIKVWSDTQTLLLDGVWLALNVCAKVRKSEEQCSNSCLFVLSNHPLCNLSLQTI